MMIKRLTFGLALVLALAVALPVMPAAAADVAPAGPVALQQDDGETQTYDNALYGLTAELPADWQVIPSGQDFDIAFVSPEAMQGATGAFLTLSNIPGLGTDTTLESALEPVAEQVSGEVEAFSTEGLDGAQVSFTDEDAGTVQHLVLLPYGDHGEAFYIQTLAPTDQDGAVMDVLNSLQFDPPQPDYSAINAAWQQSLAESGRLIYGPDDAPIYMAEFLSFTCSHCAVYSYNISRLMALDAAEGGLARIEMAPIAGDELAQRATVATYCAAEQGAGFSVYKALFEGFINQGVEEAYSEEGVRDILTGLDAEVDMDALDQCVAGNPYAEAIDENRARFTDFGLTGTPTMVVGTSPDDAQPLYLPDGSVWSGSIPVDALRTIVNLATEGGMTVQGAVDSLMGVSPDTADEAGDTTDMTTEEAPAEADEAVEEATEDATSRSTSGSSGAVDMLVAQQDTPTGEGEPLTAEDDAETETAAQDIEDDDATISPTVAVIGVVLLLAVGVGLVWMARRPGAPLVTDPNEAPEPVNMVTPPQERPDNPAEDDVLPDRKER